MKGKKCIKFLTFFITLVLSFVLFSNDTKAVDYQSSIPYNVSSAALIFNNGGTINFTNDSTGGAYAAIGNFNNTSGLNYLAIRFSGTITARSIVTFIVKTAAPLGTYPQVGWTARSAAYSVLDVTYGEYGTTFISLYVDQNLTGEFDLTATNFPITATSLDVHVSAISTTSLRQLPSYNQIQDIKTILNGMYADLDVMNARITDINTHVTSILGYIGDLVNNSDRTADAVEEQNEKDEQDRSNIESQSSDTDAEANEQGDEATQTGTSLFGAFTQLLSALTNVNGNTCTLPAMQVYTLNLGNMNLCQYDIPPQIMALVSIGMVFIIIPLGINLVKRMISLYKEITG